MRVTRRQLRRIIRESLLLEVGKPSGFSQKLINTFKTKWWDYHRGSLGVEETHPRTVDGHQPLGKRFIESLPGGMPKWDRLSPDEKRLVTVAYIEAWLNNFSDSKLSNPTGLPTADRYTAEVASSVYAWMTDALSRAQTGELDMLDLWEDVPRGPQYRQSDVAYFHTPTKYLRSGLKIGPWCSWVQESRARPA